MLWATSSLTTSGTPLSIYIFNCLYQFFHNFVHHSLYSIYTGTTVVITFFLQSQTVLAFLRRLHYFPKFNFPISLLLSQFFFYSWNTGPEKKTLVSFVLQGDTKSFAQRFCNVYLTHNLKGVAHIPLPYQLIYEIELDGQGTWMTVDIAIGNFA